MTAPPPPIVRGLPERLRPDAAALYLEAFGRKLGPILGRDARAMAFLARVMRPQHALAALDETGELLGLAGFHDDRAGLIGGDYRDLAAVYGRFGAAWRALALSVFERRPEPGDLLMDGIAVTPEARGRGVGGALLAAVIDTAQEIGAKRVRLDVVDANPRARALYERTGFRAVKEQRHGMLTRAFGFSASTTMVLPLQEPTGGDGVSKSS